MYGITRIAIELLAAKTAVTETIAPFENHARRQPAIYPLPKFRRTNSEKLRTMIGTSCANTPGCQAPADARSFIDQHHTQAAFGQDMRRHQACDSRANDHYIRVSH